jgi:hypothetical protein
MCWCARGGDRERGRQGDSLERAYSLCELTSVSSFRCRLFLCVALLLLAGCPRGEQANPQAAGESPRASVALRVLVVNEPGLADEINRLRGEWAERSGGELKANTLTWSEIAAAKSLDTDVIIFPSRYMGELCARGWLRPVRKSVLESPDFNSSDVFPLIRRDLMKWGGEVMALPLGLSIGMGAKSAEDHPGISLLAEAAPAALSNQREGALLDPETMKPRIQESAFVSALERLVEKTRENRKIGTGFAPSAPVFGFEDRLVAVSTASRNGASALKLIAWLASAEISTQLARAGSAMVPVRRSLASSSAWYGAGLDASERAKLSDALAKALNGEKCLLVPRIPGVDEYMAALDTAVKSSLVAKMPAEVALKKAAERWEQLTNERGRDSQRQAYWKNLGITD